MSICRTGIAVVIVAVASCAAPPRGDAFQLEIVDPSKAVVYIVRDAGLRQRPVRVFINQQPAGPLLPGHYISRVVPAAETLVRVEADASAALPVTLRPGEAAYMQVVIPAFGPLNPTLELLDTDSARAILAGTTRATP